MKSRLIEERKRLGFSQEKIADLGGVGKRTYCDYEAGVSEPKASFLIAIALVGADVQYILTGIRSTSVETQLSPRQQVLLNNYEHTDERGKRIIEATASEVAQPPEVKKQA